MSKKLLKNPDKRFATLFLAITSLEGLKWSYFGGLSTFLSWIVYGLFLYAILGFRNRRKSLNFACELYLLWFSISVIRGFFVLETYWDVKNMVTGVFAMSSPLLVYVFSSTETVKETLHLWLKYAVTAFFFFFIFAMFRGAYHFYLGPILLLACFYASIKSHKWKFVIVLLLLLMVFASFGARSQVIKAFFALLIVLAYYFHFQSPHLLKTIHALCLIAPVVLLVLGISGTFNIFEDLSKNEGKYVELRKNANGAVVEEDLASDTRTFIYQETITSAINHHYALFGRSMGRGYDSAFFGNSFAELSKTNRFERYSSESLFPSVFTWMGFVGVLLLSAIYFIASYRAVYHSCNTYVRVVGVCVAFRWAYGWVEDFYSYSPMIVALWMMIGICMSKEFREMDNREVKVWIQSILR